MNYGYCWQSQNRFNHEILSAFHLPVNVTKVFSGKLAPGVGSDEFGSRSIVSFKVVHWFVRIENTRGTTDHLAEKNWTSSPRRNNQNCLKAFVHHTVYVYEVTHWFVCIMDSEHGVRLRLMQFSLYLFKKTITFSIDYNLTYRLFRFSQYQLLREDIKYFNMYHNYYIKYIYV